MTRRPRVTDGIAAPSTLLRALLAVALIAALYASVLACAAAFFAGPLLYVKQNGLRPPQLVFFLFVIGWVSAALLITALFRVRPQDLAPQGDPLTAESAPGLFALLGALTRAAELPPVSRVYLTGDANLSVTEHGGERVLMVGAPFLVAMRVDELRAVVAHELGHFAFGDTRLGAVLRWAEATMRSVVDRTQPRGEPSEHASVEMAHQFTALVTRILGGTWARVYALLTHPAARRAELAADQFAARLSGRDALVRALWKSEPAMVLFHAYLDGPVARARSHGYLPRSFTEGFERFRAGCEARGVVARIRSEINDEGASVYDTHPATTERVAALRDAPTPPDAADARSATALVALDLDAWFAAQLARDGGPLERAPWETIWRAQGRGYLADAAEVCARARAKHPRADSSSAMLTALVEALARGGVAGVAEAVAPTLLRDAAMPERDPRVAAAVSNALGTLLTAALVERAVPAQFPLDEEGPVFAAGAVTLRPFALAARALDDAGARDELRDLSAMMHGRGAA